MHAMHLGDGMCEVCVSCMDLFRQFCKFDCCAGLLHWIAARKKSYFNRVIFCREVLVG